MAGILFTRKIGHTDRQTNWSENITPLRFRGGVINGKIATIVNNNSQNKGKRWERERERERESEKERERERKRERERND